MKILIVDDIEEVRDFLKSYIKIHGHEVFEAKDGQDGFEKTGIHKPDLIITDAMMPKVDGFQFLRNIKKDLYLNSIPCVFYSATYTDSKDRELALSLGAEAFIAKPKKPDEFWEEIKPILERVKKPDAGTEKKTIEDEKEFLNKHTGVVTAKLEEKVKELEKVITENKQIENALRDSKEQLQSIIDNTTTPIYLKDTEGRYLLINRQFEKVLHVSKDQLIGKTDYDLFPNNKDKADAFRMNDRRVIETKTSLMLEEALPHDDGLHTYISVKFPMYDSHGTLYGVCGISTDITEQKRFEKTLMNIVEGVSLSTGETFFSSLVLHLAKTLDVDYVFVGELSGNNKEISTIAACAHGNIVDNFTFKLAGTPCDNIINNRVCAYVKDVQKQFPEGHALVKMDVEDYAGAPLFDSDGKPLGLLSAMSCKELYNPKHVESLLRIFAAGTSSELERKRSEDAIRKSEASLANAQRIAHLGSWEWNIITNELKWSDEIYRIFGRTPQSFGVTYDAFLNSVHPDDREFLRESVNKALYERTPYSIDHRIVLPDGSERIVHAQAEVVFDGTGKAVQMNGTVQDITERKRAEEEIRRLFTAIDQSINIVFITDVKGCIGYVNSTFERVTGYAREEVIGQNPRILASGETTQAEYEELWNTILTGKIWHGIFKNKKKNGQYYWGNGLITPIRNEKGELTHFLAIQEDVTEKIKAEDRVKYLASYDELTGLRNRACFMEQLSEWLSHNKTYNQTGSLLLIDIDGFRLINDTYGHSTGDTILHRVAGFLITTLFEIDKHYVNKDVRESILGRMGGDEFAIYLPARNEKEAMATAEEIRKKLEKLRFVEISGHLTASIGIVLYPRDGSATKELITEADASVYNAKELGHNRVHIYHTQDLLLEKIHSRMEWKGRIQKAIEEERFVPWFQPILDLKDNRIHHYEALAREHDTNGETILPGAFIDAAETLGLITAIDRIIIKKTLLVQSDLRKQGKIFSISVNLSGKDLHDKEFLEFLRSMIAAAGADPKHLIFEITETAAVRDLDMAIKFIRELRSIGCSISLDDFGVGFTSFKYLKEMEVDYIKIDGSFIMKLHETQSDRIFVRAIADVAKGMGIKTIAEFVESEAIISYLREYGVDYAQGYFIGKPSPTI
ncbi:MAG: EAL domain-containing protein [Planctomycetes bacterium]|nr:EAL domain-containing protein [Planctomycetota bacterium]